MMRFFFGAAAFAILAACEVMARWVWPELFAPEPPSCGQGEDDEMAIW